MYANIGECGCTEDVYGCGYKFQTRPDEFQRQTTFLVGRCINLASLPDVQTTQVFRGALPPPPLGQKP